MKGVEQALKQAIDNNYDLNNFIPIFIFQKILEGKGVNFFELKNNEKYIAIMRYCIV